MIPYFTGIDACYSSGVFIKLTRRGPNRNTSNSWRPPRRRRTPKQRTVASLGRLDQINTELSSVISGLCALPVKPLLLSRLRA